LLDYLLAHITFGTSPHRLQHCYRLSFIFLCSTFDDIGFKQRSKYILIFSYFTKTAFYVISHKKLRNPAEWEKQHKKTT